MIYSNQEKPPPTHVRITVVGLGGVFGAAVEETVGGRFCHSVGEVVDLHVHIATEGGREEKERETVRTFNSSLEVEN